MAREVYNQEQLEYFKADTVLDQILPTVSHLKQELEGIIDRLGILTAALRSFNTGFAVAKDIRMGEQGLGSFYACLDDYPNQSGFAKRDLKALGKELDYLELIAKTLKTKQQVNPNDK